MQPSIAPPRLTGEGNSRGLGCIDVKRVCKNLEFLKEPPTMAKKLHSLPPATGDWREAESPPPCGSLGRSTNSQKQGNIKRVVMTKCATRAVLYFALLILFTSDLPTTTAELHAGRQRWRKQLDSPDGVGVGTWRWRSRQHGETRERMVEADEGMVAADDERCSDIGRDALRAGGNAVDASVATAFCLGVVNPMASGIGGGAFMLLRLTNGTSFAYDMRETAPAAAHEDMYEKDPLAKLYGGLAVGVPGEVAGLYTVWSHHGLLPWKKLVEPSIKLANSGFIVQPYLAFHIQDNLANILADKGLRETFAPSGKPLREGDICLCKNLGHTLQQIAQHGPKAFYMGDIAKAFVADVKAAGGIMTVEDLRDYKVIVRQPLVAETMGYTLITMPPPSSGGASLVLIVNILAQYGQILAMKGLLGIHRLIEAFKHTYAVRMNLADPAFVDVEPVISDMLNPKFASSLQKLILDNMTFTPTHYGGRWSQLNDHGTSHFNIVDIDRNTVSMTTTINFPFGAKVLSPSTGIVLNNEMDDFSIPGVPPPGLLPPAPQNFVRPGKRPLSSMTPTIVLKDGHLHGVLGGSGGSRIITTVAQVFLNRFVRKMGALPSVAAPRVHHQLGPNYVEYENWTIVTGTHLELAKPIRRGLKSKGHVLMAKEIGAVCQLIVQDLETPAVLPWLQRRALTNNVFYGKLTGVSDERKDGAPAGF